MNKFVAAIVSAALLAAPAEAGRLSFEAVPQEGVSAVRWLGSSKLIQQRADGRVSIAPRGVERGRLAFDVEVHNLSERLTYFGQQSVEVRAGSQTLESASPGQQARRGQGKINWTRIGVAVAMVALIGVAAAAAGGARSLAPTYMAPPARRGTEDAPAPPEAEAVPDSTGVPARHIYSGRIFVERPKGGLRDQELALVVSFNGEKYPFAFRVNDAG